MYPIEITKQFIELRSRDISLQRIAEQLGINKSTAIDWQRRYQAQIDELKAIHLDAVRERLTTRYEDELEYAMSELKRIRAELKTRDWDFEPTTFLHHAEAAAYRRVQKLCALAEFPRGGRDATKSGAASSTDGRAMCPHSAAPPHSEMGSPALNSQPPTVNTIENPSEIQPFPSQNNGGSPSAAPDPCTSPAPCVETDSENPSGIQPLSDHDQGSSTSAPVHNPDPTLDPAPCAAVGSAVPGAPSDANVNAQEPKIEHRNSKIAAPLQSEIPELPIKSSDQSQLTSHDSSLDDFGGESIPISPFESTREWLVRHGIQVSKVPKGARIITAA
jgi:hypothetical protein